MPRINIHEAKTHLSRDAKRVKAGETVKLCDRNKPFAEIRPLPKASLKPAAKRLMGQDAGKFTLLLDWDSPETDAVVADLFGAKD